jgi:hypothetical protein
MRKTLFFTAFLFLIFATQIYAQDYPVTPQEVQYKGNNAHDYNDVSGVNVIKPKTQEQTELENQIALIKRSNDDTKRNQLNDLNKRLGEVSGDFAVNTAQSYNGVLIPGNNEPVSGDNFQNTRIFNGGSGRTIKGLGTATETVGPNAGRIWTVFFFSANTSSPDSMRVLYSTNNGITWLTYATGYLGGTDKINYDDLDVEIIERPSGDRFLWVLYGYRATGGTGRWLAGGVTLNISTFAGGFFAFAWPGSDPAKRYYNVRFTSDNFYYPALAYLYIACSFDSLGASSQRVNTQKYARITNPYVSTSPVVSYQAQKFWWFSTTPGPERDLFTDIAFFRNTNDSVIVSFSGVPDSTMIFFSKAASNGVTSTGSGATSTGGTGHPTVQKTWARLSSNQNDNGSIICVFRLNIAGNWNVRYFRSSNWGNFAGSFGESINWGSTTNTNYQPDIVGKKGANTHKFAFTTLASSDSVHYVTVNSAGATSHIFKMNAVAITSGTQGPKPGFRNVANDSCFAVYCESGPYNVWSAAGCSGNITGIENNTLPSEYSLSQNYPNPFNPSTTISYSIPKPGFVSIIVYDVLGKEAAVLVNEVKQAGNFIVDFNASKLSSGVYFYRINAGGFTAVKRMILMK